MSQIEIHDVLNTRAFFSGVSNKGHHEYQKDRAALSRTECGPNKVYRKNAA